MKSLDFSPRALLCCATVAMLTVSPFRWHGFRTALSFRLVFVLMARARSAQSVTRLVAAGFRSTRLARQRHRGLSQTA
jgi:hypothetical protein